MLDILFVTDYVCPYCLVAKEALVQAMAETGIEANIRIQPMELTVYPKERVDTYSDPVRRSHYTVLVEPAKQLGLDMKLPPHVIPRPYSTNAFLGRYYAMELGKEAAYNDLMYKAYFIEELDIEDMNVLCKLVERLEMDPAAFRASVESGAHQKELDACNDYSRNVLQVKGIPTIYINDKKISLETYTKEEMIGILKSFDEPVISLLSDEEPELIILSDDDDEEAGGFTGCGEDGCHFG